MFIVRLDLYGHASDGMLAAEHLLSLAQHGQIVPIGVWEGKKPRSQRATSVSTYRWQYGRREQFAVETMTRCADYVRCERRVDGVDHRPLASSSHWTVHLWVVNITVRPIEGV